MTTTLASLAVDNIETRWPWKTALGKFDATTPGKQIWFVHPKTYLPSVIVVRIKRPDSVKFKYRGATNDRISVDFSAGGRFLHDIPVTAAGFEGKPAELDCWFREQCLESDQLFALGLARAEHRGPEGYNRWADFPERWKREVDVDSLERYCQILLIGILCCSNAKGQLDDAKCGHSHKDNQPDRFPKPLHALHSQEELCSSLAHKVCKKHNGSRNHPSRFKTSPKVAGNEGGGNVPSPVEEAGRAGTTGVRISVQQLFESAREAQKAAEGIPLWRPSLGGAQHLT